MRARDIDPKIGAIEDAMLAFMADQYINCNAGVNFDGAGQTFTITAEDQQRNRWTFTEYIGGGRVVVSPMNASLGPAEQTAFAATATNQDGAPVADAQFIWSISAGQFGTIDAAGVYTAPATITGAASDTVKCALKNSQSWTSVVVMLHP